MGDAVHELEGADINPWELDSGSEEEDEGEIDSDDSDGENTVI